jgi:hypothetical protein
MQTASPRLRAQSQTTPAVSTPLTCPYYPAPATLMNGPAPALVSAAAHGPLRQQSATVFAARLATASSHPATTHAGRGPPAAI